jgi:hypothetical protein
MGVNRGEEVVKSDAQEGVWEEGRRWILNWNFESNRIWNNLYSLMLGGRSTQIFRGKKRKESMLIYQFSIFVGLSSSFERTLNFFWIFVHPAVNVTHNNPHVNCKTGACAGPSHVKSGLELQVGNYTVTSYTVSLLWCRDNFLGEECGVASHLLPIRGQYERNIQRRRDNLTITIIRY